MSESVETTYPIEGIERRIPLDRNTVVVNLVSILLKLRIRGLPEEVQLFVTGSLDNSDHESLLKILASLSTKQARRYYSHYIIPAADMSDLQVEYHNDDAVMEDMHPTPRTTNHDPDEEYEKVRKSYDRTTTGKCYYRLVIESGRNESMYEDIPYCIEERDVLELARCIKKDPQEYRSSLTQVGPFLKQVIETWGEYLVKNTQGRNHERALKLLQGN